MTRKRDWASSDSIGQIGKGREGDESEKSVRLSLVAAQTMGRPKAGESFGDYRRLLISDIIVDDQNPRSNAEVYENLEELAANIQAFGLLSPIIVEPTPEGFRLVAGERRLRAHMQLGWDTIEVEVKNRDLLPKGKVRAVRLSENLLQKPMSGADKSLTVFDLVHKDGIGKSEVAAMFGRKPSWVTEHLNHAIMLRAFPKIRGKIDATVACRIYQQFKSDESRAEAIEEVLKSPNQRDAVKKMAGPNAGQRSKKNPAKPSQPANKPSHRAEELDSLIVNILRVLKSMPQKERRSAKDKLRKSLKL